MPRLKVCGINDVEFARAADAAGADYLGFIFEPASPRFATVGKAAKISAAIAADAAPRRVRLVGVFVSQSVGEIVSIMREAEIGRASCRERV